ncbi:kinase [Klebsiella michiganensis]|uniref:host specificity factor TipJ family phage tail protein n=1 Tax=Klebsiella oxytoca TaxID=571 RepID=UPI0010088A36|nr:host specificity factor TipJ family phage tail protein [Klebsiella oxytoca]MCW9638445.1 host specificity factor TipJ family phage tail protein [Klebsiella oxytoca]RXI15332.1 kinase [Klebsiella michiganensis]HEI9718665.1 kinase [Klebsiella oxytoca]HEI9790833.1 kinase [Klebsiella oxytoca]
MTIRFFPSRLPGEPLAKREHADMTLHDWLRKNVPSYTLDRTHPIAVDVDGRPVPPAEWPLCYLRPDSDVRIYPVPYGTGLEIAAWAAVAVAVASAAYSIIMMSQLGKSGASTANGDQLDLSPAKANTAKLGSPIREVFGRCKVYPDYLVQPVSRFDPDDPQVYRTEMFLSVAYGEYADFRNAVKIGNTPLSSFGDDASITIYPPGADVSGDRRADNWFNSPEVGGTSSGTAGLDLASTGPDNVSISADSVAVSGDAISLIGQSSDDDADDNTSIPESWAEGTVITVVAPDTFTVGHESGRNVIMGDFTELNPSVGQPVSLHWTNYDYDLFISSYTPGSPAVPGVGGSAASLTASAAPGTYDFSISPVSFTLNWAGASYIITLSANYVTMSSLLNAITVQLTGSGLIAQDDGGRVNIAEKSSPYSGNSIAYTLLPSAVFGDSPVNVAGVASTGGTPEVLPAITLAWGSATGTAFSGIPDGAQRIALSAKGDQYQITSVDGLTITVSRMMEDSAGNLAVDTGWPGFTPRTLLDASVTGVNDSFDWMGPFLCCPEGETTTEVELNFSYPQGLVDIGSKDGKKHWHDVQLTVQYRLSGSTDWISVVIKHGNKTVNMIGYTESITFPQPGNYEIRIKRDTPVWGGTTRDSVQWQSLKAKLSARPTRYQNITTMGITLRTGPRLASQSDRRVSAIITRLYDGSPSRSISGGFYYLARSLGYSDSQIDMATINQLEATYWTPRGETFDYVADSDSTSAKDIFDRITEAGMGYFLLSDGKISAGREGVKSWAGIITPHEMTEEMQTTFRAVTDDDFDGVDVKYTNPTTWAEETVQCRTPDNPVPRKIESYTIDMVMSADRAWRIGMRRLMKHIHQRRTYTTSTEMDAWCYQFSDRLVLADDIPTSGTISCLIEAMTYDDNTITLLVSEPLNRGYENPRCWIRFQNGKASRLLVPTLINDYMLTVPYSADLEPEYWIYDDPSVEPLRLLFCESEQRARHGLVAEISPSDEGTFQVSAPEYKDIFYQYDDATYPGDVS